MGILVVAATPGNTETNAAANGVPGSVPQQPSPTQARNKNARKLIEVRTLHLQATTPTKSVHKAFPEIEAAHQIKHILPTIIVGRPWINRGRSRSVGCRDDRHPSGAPVRRRQTDSGCPWRISRRRTASGDGVLRVAISRSGPAARGRLTRPARRCPRSPGRTAGRS